MIHQILVIIYFHSMCLRPFERLTKRFGDGDVGQDWDERDDDESRVQVRNHLREWSLFSGVGVVQAEGWNAEGRKSGFDVSGQNEAEKFGRILADFSVKHRPMIGRIATSKPSVIKWTTTFIKHNNFSNIITYCTDAILRALHNYFTWTFLAALANGYDPLKLLSRP